mgnify:CR=1 FL=1
MSNLVKLGSLTNIRTGKLDANKSSENGQYPFFTCSRETLRIDSYSYDCECVLVAGNGDLNVKYYEGKFDAYQRTYIIEVVDKTKLLVKYLYYFLDVYVEVLRAQAIGGVIKYIKLGYLTDALLPLPSIEKQEEIIQLFEKCDSIIELRQEQLRALEELVKLRFQEMFGDVVNNEKNWPRATLGDICEIGSSKRVFEKDYVSAGVPFFRTKEIVELSKGNKITTELFISNEHFESLKSKYGVPQKNDLLISAVGTLGTIWIVDGKFKFYFKDGNLIQIKASPGFNSVFMKSLLDELIANYKNELATGTAYSALTIAGLKKMLVCDIPLELQNQFASFVEQVSNLKFVVQKSIDKTQLLFDSLMQKYFS